MTASWHFAGEPRRVLAAVSGGADSTALLLSLAEASQTEGFYLSVVHVDHGLRAESGEDAAFVASLCLRLGIPCRIKRVTCLSSAEDQARQARYDAFEEVYLQEKADVLALAHHQGDQAETVLLHLFRGSGTEGLKGMKELSRRAGKGGNPIMLWRPLLKTEPDILKDYLREKGFTWQEDETNRMDFYSRNFIRNQVLPLVSSRFSGVQDSLCRAAEILGRENEYLDLLAGDFIKKNACLLPSLRFLLLKPLKELHPALQSRVLRLSFPKKLSFEQTEKLMQMRPGDQINLPSGWHAQASDCRLYFLSSSCEKMPLGEVRKTPFNGYWGDGKRTQAIPRFSLDENVVLRFREPGDRIRPLGAKGEKSLQDYLVDRKVDRALRDHLPLLCRGKQVLWVIGVGPGEEMRVSAGDQAWLLAYDGLLPGEIPDYIYK